MRNNLQDAGDSKSGVPWQPSKGCGHGNTELCSVLATLSYALRLPFFTDVAGTDISSTLRVRFLDASILQPGLPSPPAHCHYRTL